MIGLLLPRSLVGRVFGLYCLAMVLFVGTGLALFYRFQFTVHLDDAQLHAETLTAVVAPAVADSAVIGDYDTIQKTLERAIRDWRYSTAAFIDLKGGVVRARHDEPPAIEPPTWLVERFESHLYDSNLPINVGGQDYGVLRLSFAPERVAADLWRQTRYALWLACGGLALGLLLIRWPLGNWLGNLDRIRSLEEGLQAGTGVAQRALEADAPIEFRQTFDVLNRAAATLQAQREQAAVTLGAIADGVITLDRQGQVIAANPAACQMLACQPDDLLGQSAQSALPEVFPLAGAPEPWTGRRSEVQRGVRTYVLDTALTAVRGHAAEEAAGYVLAFRDMSEQHALDQQLRGEVRRREAALHALRGVLEGLLPANTLGSQADDTLDNIEAISALIAALVGQLQARGEQLNAIFALSPDGFVSFDRDHGINYVSSAFVELTGLNEDQVLGRDEASLMKLIRDHADPNSPPLDLASLRQPSHDGSPSRCVIELARPTRRILELALNQGNAGNITQVLHLRDITHETEVDRMKSEFLSTAAHELRTPMTSIHGFVELLLMRDMPPERRKDVLQTVRRQSTLMIAILNELLDLARIEARQGKDFELVQMNLAQLAREAIEGLSPPDQRAAPILIAGEVPERLTVRVDRMKMMQALGNVLSNAYKYSSSPGRVTVRLLANESDMHGPQVGVSIEDEGIGMTPAQLARVTERFYRADGSGNVPGTGLGMSIVKEVLTLHGGHLDMRSTYGAGSQITLWLPATAHA